MDEKKPKSPDEWVSKVEERIKDAEDWTQRRQTLINVNYYLGNQWIGWDKQQRKVVPLPQENNEERITHNIIKPRVMTKLAKQTKNRIKYDVMPDTNDQNRIEIAKGATKFIKFWWSEEEMDRKTRDIFLNNAVKAWCGAKVYFDPDEGQDIEEKDGKMLRTGEIKCRICDPLTLYIDPAATSDDEIRWIVEEKPRDLEYVRLKYNKKDISADDNISLMTSLDLSQNGLNYGTEQKKNKNMVMVREMWVAPCHEFPNGLKVTCTRKDLLDVDEKAGELPYIIFGDIPTPGSVKYTAFIQDMLPIQRNLNIALTAFATNMKRMGNSMWLVPLGSNVDEEELANEWGGILHYNPVGNAKPERAQGVDMPSMFDRIIEYYNRMIDDMSGAREITQGRLPAGLDTASGLELMVEQENEKLAVTSQNYERGMKKLLQRVLRLMKNHYTEERLGRILGPDNEIELVAFTGADLTGGEDINIVQGSSLPEMKSAQQDRIMSLWGAGAIVKRDGTPDHETLLRLLGMGDSTELFEMRQLDENKAKLENKIFLQLVENPQMLQMMMAYEQQKQEVLMFNHELQAQGQAEGLDVSAQLQPVPKVPKGLPEVRDFQDHEVHLYFHNTFRKSGDYDNLPPEIQAMVDSHVAEHEQMLMAPIIQQQQQQQVMMEQQSAEQDKQHQRNMESKQADHAMNMERDGMKAQTQMQVAAMRQPTGVR